MDMIMGPDTDLGRALNAPGGAFSPSQDLGELEVFNTRAVRAAEIPAANGVTDARSLARMYAGMVSEVDGIRVLGPAQLKAATTQQTSGPNTILMGLDIQFGLGFMLPSSLLVQRRGRRASATTAWVARSGGATPRPSWASATS